MPKIIFFIPFFSHSDPLYITVLTHSGLGQVLSTLPFTGSDPVHAKHTCVTTTVAFAAFKGTFLKNCGEAIDTPKNQ